MVARLATPIVFNGSGPRGFEEVRIYLETVSRAVHGSRRLEQTSDCIKVTAEEYWTEEMTRAVVMSWDGREA